jgi:hypothetical protein
VLAVISGTSPSPMAAMRATGTRRAYIFAGRSTG